MGLITTLIALTIRTVWFLCIGMWLGGAYLLLCVLLSPFGSVLNFDKAATNAWKLATLQ